MKKLLILTLVLCLLAGCTGQKIDPTQPSEIHTQTPPPKENVILDYRVSYYRTWDLDKACPQVHIIQDRKALDAYLETYEYSLLPGETYPIGQQISFYSGCQQYDEAFFRENYLILLLLEEGSGSTRHRVHHVAQTPDGKVELSVESVLPGGIGTCDVAYWHLVFELDRKALVTSEEDVQLYYDQQLIWNGAIVTPIQIPAFKAPPTGIAIPYGAEETPLVLGGFDWQYTEGEQTSHITACQGQRPPQKLTPIQIPTDKAETAYLPAEGSTVYEPTNLLGYFVKLHWDAYPTSVTYTCWPDTVLTDPTTPEKVVAVQDSLTFYAYPGGYIYEITATWEDHGEGYSGKASYYVYIIGGDTHTHMTALQPETVDDPITGYCGNTLTTVYLNGQSYGFMGGNSVTLTDILVNLDYDPMKVCRCLPEFTVDTEFGLGYGINLTAGYARCDKGQANLTTEQVMQVRQILEWLNTTRGEGTILYG